MKLSFRYYLLFTVVIACRDGRSYREEAMKMIDQKRFDVAETLIAEAINIEPDSLSNYLLRASLNEQRGDYRAQINDLNLIIETHYKAGNEPFFALQEKALAEVKLGLYDEALNSINICLRYVENQNVKTYNESWAYAWACAHKSNILRKLSRNDVAEDYLEIAEREIIGKKDEQKLRLQIFISRSEIQLEKMNFKKALDLAEMAIKMDTTSDMGFAARGTIFLQQTKLKLAEIDLTKAIRLNELNSTAIYNLAQIQAQTEQYESAIENYLRFVALEPKSQDNSMIYMNLATCKNAIHDFEGALTYIEKSVRLDSSNSLAYYTYSLILSDANRNEEALEKAKKAVSLSPNDFDSFNLMGTILLNLNNYSEAKIAFQKAIEKKPNFGLAYYNMGYLLGKTGEPTKSIAFYNKAVSLNYDLESTLVNQALQKIELKDFAGACIDLRRANKLGRNDIQPLLSKYCK